MLSDGQWLDIGGQDHRFINGMVKFDKRTEESFGYTNTKKMHYIMKLAKLIRFIPESRVFQTLTKPTQDQVHEIVKYCERHGKIEVGFGLKTPREYSSKATYELEDDLSSYNGE